MRILYSVVFILLLSALACASEQGPPLTNTSWTLTSMGSQAISQEEPITLEFHANNEMGGSTGCNSYFGTYDRNGPSFKADFMITEKGCPTDELFWREHQYKYALPEADTIMLEGLQLTLGTRDGRVLEFTRQ